MSAVAEARDPVAAAARHAFVRLCVVGLFAYCSYAICRIPLLPLLARELGADPPTVGLIVGASTLTGVVVKLPAGAWSDVFGRRPLLVLGAAVFAVVPFVYVGVTSLAALMALRFVHGSATAIFGPVASASLSDVAPADRRATWLSTYSTVQGTGIALGPVIAGYFIASGRYDSAFLLAGVLSVATPLIIARWPPADRLPTSRVVRFRRGIADVCRQPLILLTSLAQAAQYVLHGTLSAFLPLFAHDVVRLSISQIGWLFAMQIATTLAARPLMGMVSDRVGRRGLITAGLVVCGAGVLLVSLASTVVSLIVPIVMYAVGVAVTTSATSAYITDLSRRSQYGAAHGVFGTIYDVGDALGPIAAGILVAAVGYAAMFRIMAAFVLLVAAVFVLCSAAGQSSSNAERN